MPAPDNRLPVKREKFDPEVHPDLMKRAVLMKMPAGQIAELFGIEPTKLVEWIGKHPLLAEAANFDKIADADMVWSIYCAGMGIDPVTGDQEGKRDMKAAIFWVKARLQWTDKPPEDKIPRDVKDMSPGQILQFVDELTGKLEDMKGAAPVNGSPVQEIPSMDAPPGSHFPEEDGDAGF